MQVVRGSYSRVLGPARAWAALTCGLLILKRDFAEPSMAGPNGRADDARRGGLPGSCCPPLRAESCSGGHPPAPSSLRANALVSVACAR
jgi:hypothetical protein